MQNQLQICLQIVFGYLTLILRLSDRVTLQAAFPLMKIEIYIKFSKVICE